ncbi:hypothetical protein [Pseudomonas mosselii]|jgi:hypothetical protein|nr:hypothetical protein [Pseudomonas mosselii]MCL8299252.1 hypothetical protein [Pseudomonas mosselii]WJR30112.1 hypothetical protein LU678_008715 [Pseudomonas mosselii]WJR30663.1 hypothetical protein LU678_011695 [Pseudomonas mosselii]
MLAADFFETAYRELASRYAGLTRDVYLVPPEKMNEGTDLLNLCGVHYDEKLYFNDETADLKSYGMEQAGGLTINFLLGGRGRSAVFINENCLPPDSHEGAVWLWRYNSLHHELMHALDFSKQKNFNTSKRTMDLVGAEVFADQKTLLHLKSLNSNDFMRVALQQYARNVKTMGQKGGIRADIYNRLTRKVDEKSIDYWASIEF